MISVKRCKACDAPIVWIATRWGKNIPCDAALVPYVQQADGTESVLTDYGEFVRCRLDLNPGEYPTGLARLPHGRSCPCAELFRKKAM